MQSFTTSDYTEHRQDLHDMQRQLNMLDEVFSDYTSGAIVLGVSSDEVEKLTKFFAELCDQFQIVANLSNRL